MSSTLPPSQWKSGAIDFERMVPTASNLRMLIHGVGDIPINRRLRSGTFPDFKVKGFSLTEDHGYVINVWRVRDDQETYHVIGGVETNVDKSAGYIPTYQRLLDEILSSEEQSQHVFRILDHVITNSLLNPDR